MMFVSAARRRAMQARCPRNACSTPAASLYAAR